jgi:hypothetical protein
MYENQKTKKKLLSIAFFALLVVACGEKTLHIPSSVFIGEKVALSGKTRTLFSKKAFAFFRKP